MSDDRNYSEHDGKVAVLLSSYNGEKFLETQLNSIEKQDYKNIQLFVRDDGSTDGTVQILKSFAKHSRLHVKLIQGSNVLNQQEDFGSFCTIRLLRQIIMRIVTKMTFGMSIRFRNRLRC